jgi:hypothetical protein
MKANEALEKIYINPNLENRTWLIGKGDISFIEYIRTDAFIEKVVKFFEENIEEENCKIGSSEWTELRAEYKSLDSFIRAFVEYMKGK